jgi:uncharacterized damage-inducible protein DinB
MENIARAFIEEARLHLLRDYLPKLERCLEQLSDEQAWWRPGEGSNSVGNLLLHLEGNARQWLVSGVGGAPDRRTRDREFAAREAAPLSELLDSLRATLMEADAALQRLDPALLLERRSIQGHDVTVLAAIFHAVEHFSMHTGQIILLTKLLTGHDLAFYDFSDGTPRPNWEKSSQ